MEITHYVALHAQAVELSKTYFLGVTHAPAMYLTLGRSLENVGFALERLCMEASHPHSPILQANSRQSIQRVLWLALYKLSALLYDIEIVLRRLNVTKDRQPQWWLNFAQKTRFGQQENFMDLIQRLDFHDWALRTTTKTFNREILGRKLSVSSTWSEMLGNALQQHLSSTGLRSEASSTYSTSDQSVDMVQEFITFSDYYGRDIFEVAKLMTMVRLAMYWTHRGIDALVCLEKTKIVPVEAYGNILKAGWILQRLQNDRRSRKDECAAIVVALSEDIIFELKRISELKVALPTNEKLVKDADLRIWLDDLDPYESEKNVSQAAVTANPPDDQADVVSPLFSSRLEEDPFGNNSHQNRLPVLPLRSSHKRSASSDSPQTHSQQDKMPALPSSQRRSAGSDLPAKISSQAIVSSEHERTPTLPSSQRRSAGSDLQTKISSQGSSNETVMQSPDSRETSATFPSSIDTQRSSVQSAQSTQPSPISTESIWRKPVLKTQLPTLTEPMERSAPEPVQRRLTIPPNSMQYGVPPLHMYSNNVPEETKTEGVVSSNPNSPNQARRKIEHSFPSNVSDLQVYDPSAPPSNFVPSNSVPSNFGSISCSSDHENVPLSSIPDPPDLDERPGEVEIMKKVFQKMLLSSSDSFEIQPVWESCSIRIFRKMDSTVRILTFRDSGLDQRFISLKDTEMVPEYGYHKDLPVIFLRKISPDSHYQSPTSQASSIFMGSEDLSAASLYYRFDNSKDLFNFQLAFTGEAVEIDIKSVRTVRFKRNMLDGEHSNYKARLQLWREQTFDTVATGNSGMSSMSKSIAGTIRSRGVTESILKIPSTRLVIFFEEIIVVMFVTDSVAIEARARTNVLRIKPSSYRTFGNPSSVRARFLGTRSLSGGIKLDKKGLTLDSEDSFDEFKWFEIDFYSEEEMSYFRHDFCNIINERRKERRRVEDLKAQAANGMRSSR